MYSDYNDGVSEHHADAPRASRRWQLVRYALVACAAVLALPFILSLAFAVLNPPVSAYMLLRSAGGAGREMMWRDLSEMSTHLVEAAVTSEDARFCSHNGVDWVELEKVLDAAREDDERPTRGASTITMQTVKNLFLWPAQSYLRKGLEIPLAYWFDLIVPKRRILEIYLNIVEWAPGVYGAEAASRHHFGRGADKLTREQASLLAATLPNPIARRAGKPGRTTLRVARSIRRRMATIGPYIACLRAP